ncbi:MAG: hypothetical protein HDT46_05315 [Ruminococcaceae bacterium]|nr:hypothetical protein [Oscillospiraceae bacterium]
MAIEGFEEIFNTIYIAKKLYDIGKYDLVKGCFYDTIECDTYYENMFYLLENLFEHQYCHFSDRRAIELRVISDQVIANFYLLAGEHGERHNIADENNFYIKEAEKIINDNLNYTYSVECKIMWYTDPKRKHRTRLGMFIYQDDWFDYGGLVYALIEVYEWFSNRCADLRKLLSDEEFAGKEVIAA